MIFPTWARKGCVWCYRTRLGTCYLIMWDEIKDEWSTEVYSLIELYVKKKRHGDGTKIVNSCIRKCKQLGIKRIAIVVRETKEAKEFWKKFGIVGKGYIEVQ